MGRLSMGGGGSLFFTSEVFGIEVVALVFGGQVSRDPQGPRQGQEPRATGAEGQARRVGGQGDSGSVVRQVLELLLLWPQGRRGRRGGREGDDIIQSSNVRS